ncbi:MAG TPA: GlsB/YeaQ/YmgE family stress response membrane protein [Gaiellaceae bacterium]|nr:GlsB/YeaQ/YmgE family stress response membrane protein [Gaiellaceae bacterium]
MTVVVVLLVIIAVLLFGGILLGLALELIWLAITGLIVGGLGRLVLPGRQNVGLLTTALVGIAASLLGGILGDIFNAGWIIRFLVAIALAAIGIALLNNSAGGRRGLDRA